MKGDQGADSIEKIGL